MRDLRSYLDAEAAAVWELPGPLALRHELTALQHELDQRGEFTILLARQLAALDGAPSPLPLVTNLTASRGHRPRARHPGSSRQPQPAWRDERRHQGRRVLLEPLRSR